MFRGPFGLRQFGTIAYNAFMEVAQQPVYLLLMASSGFFCVFLSVVPYFGFGDDIQIVKTSTLAVMLVTGLFGAVLSASSSVAREIRSGTALAVLSKPVGRARFILGKYVGLSGALTLLVVCKPGGLPAGQPHGVRCVRLGRHLFVWLCTVLAACWRRLWRGDF